MAKTMSRNVSPDASLAQLRTQGLKTDEENLSRNLKAFDKSGGAGTE